MLATIVTASLTAVVTAEQAEIRLLLMPLVGALVGTTGMILLAPSVEDRRRIAGRGLFSIAIGSGAPVLFGFVTDYGRAMAGHPVALFMFGIMASMVVFAVSRPLAEALFARSRGIAATVLDAGEAAITKKLPKP